MAGMSERDLMERDREYAAMGWLSPDCMRDMAAKAALRGYGILKTDPERAWEFLQFSADLQRASLPEREAL